MHDQLSAQAIISVSDFKARTSEYLQYLREQGPIVLTQNGKSAGVLLSPQAHDQLHLQIRELSSIAQGLADGNAGRTISTDELRQHLAERLNRTRNAG
ncbi:type II toxin-antitoxin system prevent-host-death family antitoxin [bacterium]|nr:type II toxin-antitoxin system prevent-host-death family antitoxin [bacterium]